MSFLHFLHFLYFLLAFAFCISRVSETRQKFGKFGTHLPNPPPLFGFKRVKLGVFYFPPAHFVSFGRVWANGVKVRGLFRTGGILSQLIECVNALRALHLHIQKHVIRPAWGSDLGRLSYSQDA